MKRSVVAVAATTLVVVVITVGLCRQVHGLDESQSESEIEPRLSRGQGRSDALDDSSDDSRDTALELGSSRSIGGDPVESLIPWLIILWKSARRKDLEASLDGLLTGMCARLNNNYTLCSMESVMRTGGDECTYAPEELATYTYPGGLPPDHIQYIPTFRIDTRKGLAGGPNMGRWAFRHVRTVKSNLAIFELYPYNGRFDRDAYEKLPLLKKDQFPIIQTNKSVGENCFVYSYSMDGYLNTRQLSRWPVVVTECTDLNICKLAYDKSNTNHKEGRVCTTWSDVGAPVLCSGKLSYMVLKPPEPVAGLRSSCEPDFRALRLADFSLLLLNPKLAEGIDGRVRGGGGGDDENDDDDDCGK